MIGTETFSVPQQEGPDSFRKDVSGPPATRTDCEEIA